jgi:two-component system, chemotaxis family, chemotaxis protein CheY
MQSILAVDDSASMRQMLGQVLRGAGYEVVEARDGAEALEKASGQSFDVVITDQNMPNVDGLTLTARLRSMPRYRSVPILVLTTESDQELKSAGRPAGATGWLVKPFDPVRLVEVIHKVAGGAPGARP